MKRNGRLRIAVLGDGGWGTTLAIHLLHQSCHVTLWSAFPDYADVLTRTRKNPRFLPGVRLPESLRITADPRQAVAGAALVVCAVPSQHVRAVAKRFAGLVNQRQDVVSVSKGIEHHSLLCVSQVLEEVWGLHQPVILSGPSVAYEVARGQPTSVVAACRDARRARRVQQVFGSERLRVYTSGDPAGVELGGALKNPVAIAAGIGDGLGFGANAKAALVTRGIVEMARLGAALDARAETFWGLSGLGDLVTTCISGRNRWFGEQVGQGRRPQAVLRSTPMVIEGVETARSAVQLAKRRGVELPIIEQVYAILFEGKRPKQALTTLMQRKAKAEI